MVARGGSPDYGDRKLLDVTDEFRDQPDPGYLASSDAGVRTINVLCAGKRVCLADTREPAPTASVVSRVFRCVSIVGRSNGSAAVRGAADETFGGREGCPNWW